MKQITNLKELKKGTQIVQFIDGRAEYFDFLMVHPRNNDYVLLLNITTQDAISFYMPRIVCNESWQIECTSIDVLQYQYNYHMEMARRKLQRLLEQNHNPLL